MTLTKFNKTTLATKPVGIPALKIHNDSYATGKTFQDLPDAGTEALRILPALPR